MVFHFNVMVGPRHMLLHLGFARVELTPLLTIGWVGVNIFFVLSGFLLTIHFAELLRRGPLAAVVPGYLRGRILRVVPAYWAQIAIFFALAWIAAGAPPPWMRYVPAHLVFLQNTTLASHSAISGVYWTLPVEFSFYLALPFVATWILGAPAGTRVRRAGVVALGALALSVSWRVLVHRLYADDSAARLFFASTTQFPGLAEQFAAGVAAATIFLAAGLPDGREDRRWALASDVLVIAGLAGLVGLMYLMHRRFEEYWSGSILFYAWHPAAAACIALLVMGVAACGRLARVVDAHGLGFARFAAPLALAVSALSYFAVERPFLRRKQGGDATARAGGGRLQ